MRRVAAQQGETAIDGRDRRAWGWVVVGAWVLSLTAVLLWPVTRSGYLLGHDMVFTPQQPLSLEAIGVSATPPRAVPVDALVALAERLLDGAVVGRLAVILPLLAAGTGVAAVLWRSPLAARLTACTVAIWNPFVVERMALGQWALLWCYGSLPWLLIALTRRPAGERPSPGSWAGRAAALAAGSITPTGGLISASFAVVMSLRREVPRRERLCSIGLAIVMQLPWLVPSLVTTAAATSDPRGVAAFAARSEHLGGTALSLLGGGGIWDQDVVPRSRGGPLPWLWLGLLLVAAVFGLSRLTASLGRPVTRRLLCVAAAGLLLALLPSMPGGAAILRVAVRDLPGAGLLRDAQKWVLPLVMVEALLAGSAVERGVLILRAPAWRLLLAIGPLALPVIVLPDAAATLRPTMQPVQYPSDWTAVARVASGGDAAVLPWGSYRDFGWARGKGSVLDPAPRLLQVPTVVDDRLAVSGVLLRGESRRADDVRRGLDGAQLPVALARLGIHWVVIEHGTTGAVPRLGGLRVVHRGSAVSLYAVPGARPSPRASPVRTGAVLIGDGLAVMTLAGVVATWLWRLCRRPVQASGAG